LPGLQTLTDVSIPTELNDKCMPLPYDAISNDSSFLDSSSDSGIEQEDNSNFDIKTISLHDLTNTLDLTTSTCVSSFWQFCKRLFPFYRDPILPLENLTSLIL
jgi:hypothetical protein